MAEALPASRGSVEDGPTRVRLSALDVERGETLGRGSFGPSTIIGPRSLGLSFLGQLVLLDDVIKAHVNFIRHLSLACVILELVLLLTFKSLLFCKIFFFVLSWYFCNLSSLERKMEQF